MTTRTQETKASTQAQIDDALARASDRVRAWVIRQIDDSGLDIARLYQANRDILIARLRQTYETYLADEPTIARARLSPAGAQLDAAIDDAVSAISSGVNDLAVTHLTDTLAMQPRVLNKELGKWLGVEFAELPMTTQTVLGELTTSVVGGGGTFFDHLFHVNDELRRSVVRGVRTGLLNGDDFWQIRDRVMKAFGVDKLPEPSQAAYGAVKTYRNAALSAWNDLMDDQAEKAGAVRVWWAILEGPLARTTTPGCAARHGMRIDEDLDGELPPAHYNCRCSVSAVSPDTDLRPYREAARAFLQNRGISMRAARQMESARWGESRLTPLLHALGDIRSDEADAPRYVSLPWRDLPAAAVRGVQAGAWQPASVVAETGAPDHVLLRRASGALEVRTDDGWRDLKSRTKSEMWIETVRGYALDAATLAPQWDRPRRRLPMSVVSRWPALRALTFPREQTGTLYAAKIIDAPAARRLSLGERDADPWAVAETLTDAAERVIFRGVAPGDAHLVIGLVPEDRAEGSGVDRVARSGVDLYVIVSLGTGDILFSKEEFHGSLRPPYERVGIVCPEDGLVWAIRVPDRADWVLPGGHIEPGELGWKAAVREMREETGVTVEITRLLGALYRPWATTRMFLARRVGPTSAPETHDEITGVARVRVDDLSPGDRAFVSRFLGVLTEARFDPAKHPRGKKGSSTGGKFVKKGGGGAGGEVPQALAAGATPAEVSIRPIGNKPTYTGGTIPTRTQLSKQENGALAEQIVIGYLHAQGFTDARSLNVARNNFPLDFVQDHEVIEVKGGPVSNVRNAQRWKLTIGQPRGVEAELLASMSPEKKRRYNERKVARIIERKQRAVREISRALGRPVTARTMTVIFNPDTKRADIHSFDGFHPSIEWRSTQARQGYVTTVSFAPKTGTRWADLLK